MNKRNTLDRGDSSPPSPAKLAEPGDVIPTQGRTGWGASLRARRRLRRGVTLNAEVHTQQDELAAYGQRTARPTRGAQRAHSVWRVAPRRWARRCALTGFAVAAVAGLIWLLLPSVDLFPPGLGWSRQVLDRQGQLLHTTLAPDGRYRLPCDLETVSPDLIAATLAHEDRHFFRHAGVNPLSLARAAWGALTGQRLGGGSTLTMQYARLRFGLHTRSWSGKLAQILRAVQLERHYSKREILTAYFTLAPYGGNVEGVTAASLQWCGKSPSDLTRREAIALSVIPQSPAARCPRPGDNPALMAAQARLLEKLRRTPLSRGTAARGVGFQPPRIPPHNQSSRSHVGWKPTPREPDSLDAQFCLHRQRVPRGAPHFSRRVLTQSPEAVVRSTLDATAQQELEATMTDFLRVHADHGLDNGAALLVHAPTRDVRACIGSSAFFNDAIRGQIDGTRARRSPGSTLKPFLYALALDHGLIHPRTLLEDAPRRFAEYQPENADREFLGPVTATEALWRSRNLPAIDLAARLPHGGLHAFLLDAGVPLDPTPARYGLTLPLGGAELTLAELAGLYAMLAGDGSPRPLRIIAPSVPVLIHDSRPLLTAASCFLVRGMLESDPAGIQGLAVKTGTSHGFRDAWAVGVCGEWVLAVWVGHFDGRPMPNLFARDTAAPLLRQMVARLGLAAAPDPAPRGVAQVEVCAVSGGLLGPHCRHRAHSWFIPGVSPIASCDVHREVLVDPATGLAVARDDGTRRLERRVCEFWSAEQLALFRRAGVARREPPAFEPHATPARDGRFRPRIRSPQPRLTYTIRASDPERSRVPLIADASPGVRRIQWFLDQRLLGTSAPAEAFLWAAPPGRWTLRACDDRGGSTKVELAVELVP